MLRPQPTAQGLYDAVEYGQEGELSDCLARGADPAADLATAYRGPNGHSALTIAVGKDHAGCVRLLAAARADLNDVSETVLIKAAINGQTSMCRQLLELGADHTLKLRVDSSTDGRTALEVAKDQSSYYSSEELILNKFTTAAMLEAWAGGTRDAADLDRVVAQAPVKAALNEELCDAAERGEDIALSDCLARGADPNAVKRNGSVLTSVLRVAVEKDHRGCMGLLVAAGADLDHQVIHRTNNGSYGDHLVGDTALVWAAKKGHTSMCRLLLEFGADHTLKCKPGRERDARTGVWEDQDADPRSTQILY